MNRTALLKGFNLGRRPKIATAMHAQLPLIGEVRGLGLLLGVELLRDGKPAAAEADAVICQALRRGLSFKTTMGNILTLTPPPTVAEEELTRLGHSR